MSFVGTITEKNNISIWIVHLDDHQGTPYVSSTGFPNATSQRNLSSVETIHDHFGDGISINTSYSSVLDLPTGLYVFDVRVNLRAVISTAYTVRLGARGLNVGTTFSSSSSLTRIARISYPSWLENNDNGGQADLNFVYKSVNDEGKVAPVCIARSHSSGSGGTINYIDANSTDSTETGKTRILIMRIE